MTDVLGESRVAGVALSDGSRIDADVVVVGIGVTPNTEWLERSCLTIDNRIVCNGSGEAYDRRIQFIGGGPPHDEIVIVDGSLADRRLTALHRRGDRLLACLALNQPRALTKYRKLLAAGESWNAAISGPAASKPISSALPGRMGRSVLATGGRAAVCCLGRSQDEDSDKL